MSSVAIDQLTPIVRACCATCELCGFRDSNDDEPPLRYCQRDGMVVDDHHNCSGYVPVHTSSPARSVALAERRPSPVDVPSLGVSSLDLGPGASASGPLSREAAGG